MASVNKDSKIGVLFVCTGNICRSPTAEGVFRHMVREAGLEGRFDIASAGVDSYHAGEAPDARSIDMAEQHGVYIAHQRARHFTPDDFADFDYIYAMDAGHMRAIKQRQPKNAGTGKAGKISMFLESGDVPDPWYGGTRDFKDVYDMIEQRCKTLLHDIIKENSL